MAQLTFDVSEEIRAMFDLTAVILKADRNKAFEKMIRDYTATLISNDSGISKDSETPSVSPAMKTPKAYCQRFDYDRDARKRNPGGKALHRLRQWARKPWQLNHQCIRAFLQCAHGNEADWQEMKSAFMQNTGCSAHQFEINLISMTTESGNSHGRVFEVIGNRVLLVEEIKDELRQYENCFLGKEDGRR